jgi:hypothetical protein
MRVLKKFERCRLFSFLLFFPGLGCHALAEQAPSGITDSMMDVSRTVVSFAECCFSSMGLGLGSNVAYGFIPG